MAMPLLVCASGNGLAAAIATSGRALVGMESSPNSIETLPKSLRLAADKSFTKNEESFLGVDGVPLEWVEQKVLATSGAARDILGWSVAIDENTAVIGAPNNLAGPGKVIVFTNTDGTWTETQELTASDPAGAAFFGSAVAISGTTALIGASYAPVDGHAGFGAVYVFTHSGGTWTQVQKFGASDGAQFGQFGSSIAFDGATAIIGAYGTTVEGNPNQGAAYVFTESDSTWIQVQKLIAGDGAAQDQFGYSVAIDGATALIGAFAAGVNGNAGQGAAYVFAESGGIWTNVQKLTASDGAAWDQFGCSVALNSATALVGAFGATVNGNPSQGVAYVFNEAAGTWSEGQKLTPSNGALFTQFGYAISLNEAAAVFGAPGGNSFKGAAYMFSESGGVWAQAQEFVASDGAQDDQYGYAVALDGRTVLTGAPYSPSSSSASNRFQGAGYFYLEPTAVANIAPSSLIFALGSGDTSSSKLVVSNSGSASLTYAIAEAPANSIESRLHFAPGAVSDNGSARSNSNAVLGGMLGARHAAPWTARAADGDLSFVADDGTYEGGVAWNGTDNVTEYPAIWLNRFAPPVGTGAFVLDSISILWPQTPNGTLAGKQVNLVAYYDSDGDGDPTDAVRLGGDHIVTITTLDAFTDYTVNFSVPSDGDIYIGYESTYALGGTRPLLFPGARDISDFLQSPSWLAGMDDADPDPNNLGNNEYLGTSLALGVPGTWMIRAAGVVAPAGQECSSPSDVPWLSESPTSGSVAIGASGDVTVTADAAGLSPGNYSAVLCVTTNDPANALVQIPVSLTVTADVSDAIFQDGFDSAP